MKKIILSLFFCLTFGFSFGQTQGQMTQEAGNNYAKADKELNTVYQRILSEYKSDTVFIKNLKTAQRLWIQFRDAEMKAKYPDREEHHYGSVQPMCWNEYLTDLTEERIKKLRVWLTGISEGDACQGSVKLKN